MRIDELLTVVDHIHVQGSETGLVKAYDALISAVARAMKRPQEEHGPKIRDRAEAIEEIQKQLEPARWHPRHVALFDSLDTGGVLGVRGSDRVQKILGESFGSLDPARERLQEDREEVRRVLQVVDRLKDGLERFRESDRSRICLDGRATATLRFAAEASIASLDDLSRETKVWQQIFAAFAQLTGVSERDPPLYRVDEGSLELTVAPLMDNYAVLVTAWAAVLGALVTARDLLGPLYAKKVDREDAEAERARQEAKKYEAETRVLNAEADLKEEEFRRRQEEHDRVLREQAEKMMDLELDRLVVRLLRDHAPREANDGDTKNKLQRALVAMMEHKTRGGDIICQTSGVEDSLAERARMAHELSGSLGQVDAMDAAVIRGALRAAGTANDGEDEPPPNVEMSSA